MGPHRLVVLVLVLVACGTSLAFASEGADSCGQHSLARRATPPPGHDPGRVPPGHDPVKEEDGAESGGSEPPEPQPPAAAPVLEDDDVSQGEEPAVPDASGQGDETGCREDFAADSGDDETEDDALASRAGTTRPRDPNRGGRGPDRFVGDSGVDHFFGGAGDDYLDGGGGADELRGGPDDDVLVTGARSARAAKRVIKRGDYANGGPGDDLIRARNGRRDHVECGGGRDRVQAERGDIVSRNCERVRLG
jgi:hypothetical protein